MNVPSGALPTYERLRAEVMDGRARPEGLAAVVYHGMLRGLTVILTDLSTSAPAPQASAPVCQDPSLDPKLLHLLANMVLQFQSQVTHVY